MAGIDIKELFSFLIDDIMESVEYHVLVPLEQHRKAFGHMESAENTKAENVDSGIAGLFSKTHQGVFTRKGTFAHLHIVDEVGNARRVYKLAIGANARIRFPN